MPAILLKANKSEEGVLDIRDSVVIVTGASAGIGAAAVRELAGKGANVVATARRADRLAALVDELAAFPGRRLAVAGDVRDITFAKELIAGTIAEFGRVDVLVNNAGLGQRVFLSEMTPGDVTTLLETNVNGLIWATQAIVPQMKKQGSGQIINISSIVGQRPLALSGLYCASKTAVNFISRALRMELQHSNITVTLVYPGRTLTEFGTARLGGKGDNPSPIGRTSAEKVARAIAKAIQYRKVEVYVTWYDWLFTHINRLFPRSIDWILGQTVRFVSKEAAS